MEPIAIIGFSFRLPGGAEDDSSLWQILESGRNVMTEWPSSRANIQTFYSDDPDSRQINVLRSRGAHFLKSDIGIFDAPFFSITSKEASSMDPQQGMLLETAYRALENAGLPVDKVAGTATGVFSGSMSDDFIKMVTKDPEQAPTNTATGASMCLLANRLSWYFDLKGPSIQVNTACSSSMMALDLACQSLRTGQSSMALVTGSNVMLSPEMSLHMHNMNFLSPDSVCYSFDHRANGYGRGEGVVVFVLKRLADAVRDGDVIRAVIRGTGANQDGHTPGITQPSLASQEELIRSVYKSCGLGLESTRYVEAHGTGTKIGDATEAKALGRVFRRSRSGADPLYVGSVKANIGHLEGTSALAGILKAIMILEKGIIPPNALFEKWNPNIDAKLMKLAVPTRCVEWPSEGLRRISVNSFGFGGSNGHVILDDAYHALRELGFPSGNHHTRIHLTPKLRKSMHMTNGNGPSLLNGTAPAAKRQYRLLVWSAKDEEALKRTIQGYVPYLETHVQDPESLDQLAYTLSARRSIMTWRSFAVVRSDDEDKASALSTPPLVRSSPHADAGLAFIFTGQGAQYANMGMALVEYPVFRSAMEEADTVFRDLGADWSLFDAMQQPDKIDDPQLSQPLCTALQLALVELLHSFDIVPTAVVGHSSGEIAAAYAIGALSFASACKVAYHRGRLAGRLRAAAASTKPGAMVSVNIPESEVQEYLDRASLPAELGDIHVACINSPGNVTLSGDEAAIDALQKHLESNGIFARKLTTGVAYHSPAMQAIADEYGASLASLDQRNNTSIIMVSSVTGQKVSRHTLSSPRYWVDNLVSPVRFADALLYLSHAAPRADAIKPITTFLEVGPHGALRRPVTDTLSHQASTAGGTASAKSPFTYLPVLSKPDPPTKAVLALAGHLFTRGYPLSLPVVNHHPSPTLTGSLPPTSNFRIDLPAYPFTRPSTTTTTSQPQTYLCESRLSRAFRLRSGTQPAATSLLGAHSAEWNPLRPTWRKTLRVRDMPWLAGHVVGGSVLVPAAGMVLMAVEAVREMQLDLDNRKGTGVEGKGDDEGGNKGKVKGWVVKEAVFARPIVVNGNGNAKNGEGGTGTASGSGGGETDGTEVMTYLTGRGQAHERTGGRWEVVICALVDGYWNECFRGTVVTVLEDSVGATGKEIDGGREERAWTELLTRGYDEARAVCDNAVGKSEFYAWQSEHGLKYGELFAIAQGVCWGEDQSVAEIQPASGHLSSHHLVHPAILDAAFQVCSAAPSQGMTKSLPTCIPHKMQDVWITASGWQQDQQQARPLKVCTKSIQSGGVGLVSSLTVLSDQGLPLCHIKCLEMSPIATSDKSGAENSRRRKLLTSIEWKPSLSMLSPSQLREYCLKYIHGTPVTSPSQQDSSKLACSVRRVVRRCLPQLQATGWPDAPPHMKKYVSWLASRFQDTSTISTESPNNNKGILADLTALSPPLAAIATQLLFHINSPSSSHPLFSPSEPATSTVSPDLDLPYPPFPLELTTLLHLSAHQSPTQKILALNTGTDGGLAQHVLSVLGEIEQRTGGVAFTEFVYADADGSKTFLNMAQRKLAEMEVGERVRFVDFGDAAGLEEREFDMIFVGTRMVDRDGVLGRVRRLLKAGGKLVVFDTAGGDPELDFLEGFALGVLPDWWGGDEESEIAGRVKSDAALDRFLKDSGFSGVDLVVRGAGQQDGYRVAVSSAMVDDTSSPGSADQRNALFVIDDQPSDYQQGLVSCMTGKAPFEHSSRITISQLASNDALSSMDVVFLGDIDGSLLAQLPESTLKSLQTLAQRSRNLLWVTSSPSPAESPYSGLKDGLLRTLRAEFTRSRIVSLSIQDHTSCESIQEAAGHIAHVFNAAFGPAVTPEVEYVVRDGLLHVGRLIQEPALDEELLLATTDPSSAPLKVTTEPWLPGPPLRLAVQSPGSLETLSYVDDTKYRSAPLGPNEVEVEAKAWGLNFRDVFIALGRLPGEIKEGLGGDCAGVVTRVGEGCEEFRPGDRVFLLTFGCMRMFPRADQRAVIKIPDALGFAEACAVMFPAVTAWQSLAKVARLEKGEKVLVHAAAGATGQMAVQIARYLGAEVFATVGYEHKKRLLLETYGDAVKEERVLYSRDTSFTKGVMRLTDGYGVDVVLNSLAGEGLRESWECIAPYGRFIEIGKVDIQANSALHMAQFAKNVSFSAVDLRHVMASRPDMGKRLMREVMDLVGDGVLVAPSPVHTYPASAVVDAFRYFQSGRNTGRVVIDLDRAHEVQKHLIPPRRSWSFDSNAAYLVAGGLGGIGRSILKWMAQKGARHLIVPSRSGVPSTGDAANVIDELTRQGVNVATPKCDVSVVDELAQVVSDCKHPIRGCINAAMVLQDSIFETMTHAQWQRTIRSKVQTSWNLHTLLPTDLDFFILLSSISGIIGNAGQASYAAGCTFQDALAQHRQQCGQKATSIDLGAVRGIGVIAETEGLGSKLSGGLRDLGQIEEADILAALDMFCDPSHPPPHSQIIMGVGSPAELLARGLDPPDFMRRPLFSAFSSSAASSARPGGGERNYAALFERAKTAEERAGVVREFLAKKLARALSIKPEDVDARQPLHAFGVDSLVAVEVRNWFATVFAADVAVYELMGGRSVAAICDLVVKASQVKYPKS